MFDEYTQLKLEWEFYTMGISKILFICKNESGIRYLCSCCQLDIKYVICQVSNQELLDLMANKTPIRNIFENNRNTSLLAAWDGEAFTMSGPAPEDLLPQKDMLLDINPEKTADYAKLLQQEI